MADIAKERLRQHNVEGWTPEHDDTHDRGEMLTAAWWYMQRHADADMWGVNVDRPRPAPVFTAEWRERMRPIYQAAVPLAAAQNGGE